MVLTTEQASESLGEVAAAQRKARKMQGYSNAAPHFFLWGMVWIAGYALMELLPGKGGLVWLVLDVIGITGSFLLGRRQEKTEGGPRRIAAFFIIVAALAAFILATLVVMQPQDGVQVAAFFPLLAALVYTAVGAFAGVRWMVIGIALAALTMVGFLLLREHFMLWMALVGGSALILTGVWMRRV